MTALPSCLPAPRRVPTFVAALCLVALAACGDSRKPGGTQVAATVDKGEISVHQINLLMQQSRVRPEQADSASRVILDRLIEQELMVRKAEALKLDREPRVMQMMEGARRDVLARAYAEHTAEAAGQPAPDEVNKFYESRPDLFQKRRVYSLHELEVPARPEQVALLRERVKTAKSMSEIADYVKAQSLPARVTQSSVASEAVPAGMLASIAKMADGQALMLPDANGARIVVKVSEREAPLTLEQAQQGIQAMLLAERRKKAVEADLAAMRQAAVVQKLGKFAEPAASIPAATAAASGSASPIEPVAQAASGNGGTGTAVSAKAMDKGLAGLK